MQPQSTFEKMRNAFDEIGECEATMNSINGKISNSGQLPCMPEDPSVFVGKYIALLKRSIPNS